MPISGSLEEASLPDVLQLLSLGKKTGCLSLTEGSLRGYIYLDKGRVTYATVVNHRDRIGDSLVRDGRITREQLEAAVQQEAQGEGKRVTQILLESGQVDRADLERFVRAQVEEAVYFLFAWKSGFFTFTSKARPEDQDFLVSIDPEGLLLEGARRVDEWSVIKKRIPSFDLVFKLKKDPRQAGNVTLSDEQKQILPFLDGSQDVAAMADATGMTEFHLGKALYGLISAGFAKLVERRQKVRHLDYRELLAYLVHEAEFADHGRRKQAALHIADCSTCTQRLKKIHVRRTAESRSVEASETTESVGTPSAAVATQDVATDPTLTVPAEQQAADRAKAQRKEERRNGLDQRRIERRKAERRRGAGTALPSGRVEQRSGRDRRRESQRISERRAYAIPQRRSIPDAGRLAVAAAGSATAIPRDTGSRWQRTTGPRSLPPGRSRTSGGGARRISEATPDDRRVAEEAPAAVGPAATPTSGTAAETDKAPSSPPEAPPETTRATAEAAPSSADAKEGKSTDFEWLITPRESLEMLRAGRPAKPQPSKTATSARQPAAGARTPAATDKAAPAGAVTTAPPAPSAELVSEGMETGGPPAAESGGSDRTGGTRAAAAVPQTSAHPGPWRAGVRWLAMAAAVVMIAGLGWWGRSFLTTTGDGESGTVRAAVAQQAVSPAPEIAGTDSATLVAAAIPIPALPATQESGTATDEPAGPPTQDDVAPDARTTLATRAAPEPVQQPPGRSATAVSTPVTPAPVALTGSVLEAGSERPLAGVRVTISGTGQVATTDADGTYRFAEPPVGDLEVVAALSGYLVQRAATRVSPDRGGRLDLSLRPTPPPPPAPVAVAVEPTPPPNTPPPEERPREEPPAAVAPEPLPTPRRETDPDLLDGTWVRIDREEAEEMLGRSIVTVPGLEIESIAKPGAPGRSGIRIAQLLESGERLELLITRPPFLNRARGRRGNDARVTAIRVAEASAPGASATGTARLGSYLITAKATVPTGALQAMLARVTEPPPEGPDR